MISIDTNILLFALNADCAERRPGHFSANAKLVTLGFERVWNPITR